MECDAPFGERILGMETYIADMLNLDNGTWEGFLEATVFSLYLWCVYLEMVRKDGGQERENQAETTMCGVSSERKQELFEKHKN